jgi:hypothetical protein
MDTNTTPALDTNARVIAIRLERVLKHICDAHDQVSKIDPSVFPAEVIVNLANALEQAYDVATSTAGTPIAVAPKPERKAKAPKVELKRPTLKPSDLVNRASAITVA